MNCYLVLFFITLINFKTKKDSELQNILFCTQVNNIKRIYLNVTCSKDSNTFTFSFFIYKEKLFIFVIDHVIHGSQLRFISAAILSVFSTK